MKDEYLEQHSSPELPRPVAGTERSGKSGETAPQKTPEVIAPIKPELPTSVPLPSAPPPVSLTQQPSSGQATAVSPTTPIQEPPTVLPSIADDVDLIEKEWVEKAKMLVEKTKDDPHQQNKELSRIKADYIKKRYNKELKVAEE